MNCCGFSSRVLELTSGSFVDERYARSLLGILACFNMNNCVAPCLLGLLEYVEEERKNSGPLVTFLFVLRQVFLVVSTSSSLCTPFDDSGPRTDWFPGRGIT